MVKSIFLDILFCAAIHVHSYILFEYFDLPPYRLLKMYKRHDNK